MITFDQFLEIHQRRMIENFKYQSDVANRFLEIMRAFSASEQALAIEIHLLLEEMNQKFLPALEEGATQEQKHALIKAFFDLVSRTGEIKLLLTQVEFTSTDAEDAEVRRIRYDGLTTPIAILSSEDPRKVYSAFARLLYDECVRLRVEVESIARDDIEKMCISIMEKLAQETSHADQLLPTTPTQPAVAAHPVFAAAAAAASAGPSTAQEPSTPR